MLDKISIGVIDDGINKNLFELGKLNYDIEITRDLQIREQESQNSTILGHADICAKIIKKYAPKASISSIKIFNKNENGIKEQLVKAIEWCTDKEIRLLNLSLGTIYYNDFMKIKDTVEYAYRKGVIIIAASNNVSLFTYPASLPHVIGVRCDRKNILANGDFIYNSYAPDGIDITACGSHTLKSFAKKILVAESNSFATPLITSYVYDILTKQPEFTLEEIKNELKKHSCNRFDLESKAAKWQGKNINIPLIVIYDYTNEKDFNLTNDLAGFFREDGYYAVATADTDDKYSGLDYVVPFASYSQNHTSVSVYDIEILNNVYEPDVLIVGINNCDMNNMNMEFLERNLEIDIKILIVDRITDLDKTIFDNRKSEIIILVVSDEFQSHEYESVKIFYYSNLLHRNEIYKYIRDLFDKDNSNKEMIFN